MDKELLMPKPIPPVIRAPQGMDCFTIYRTNDQSGISGTGIIAQGVRFATGHVAVQWLTPPPDGDLQTKDSLDKFLSVHVLPHPENETIITWANGRQEHYPPKDEGE